MGISCTRDVLFFVLVIDNYCSLVHIFGKRQYLASCTMYGPLTKPWVVRWLMYFGKLEFLASCTM